jgi:flagellar hook-basal body complex protein FliE
MNPVAASSTVSSIAAQNAGSSSDGVSKANGGNDFSKLVTGFIEETNRAQVSSDQAINDLVTGKTDNVQQVVMAVANAEMSFQLFMEIRNKLIDSYNDLMRMQF